MTIQLDEDDFVNHLEDPARRGLFISLLSYMSAEDVESLLEAHWTDRLDEIKKESYDQGREEAGQGDRL